MNALRFDSLKYANKLKEVGIDPIHAERMAELQEEIIDNVDTNTLATKRDIQELKDLIHANTWKTIGLLAGLQGLLHFIK